MKRTILFSVFFSLLTITAFSFEPVSSTTLLLSYLENDTSLQNLTLSLEKTKLSYDSTQISTGFDIALSTGSVSFKSDGNGLKVSAKPSIQASIPQASNLTITASTELGSKAQDSAFLKDSTLSLGVDIIGSNSAKRKITLMKAERNVVEAERKLLQQAIATETQFYTEIKKLLSSTNSIIQAQSNLYSDEISFEAVKARGYSKTSSTYRLAEMKVISDKHNIESDTRALIHDYIVFYKKCGYDISINNSTDFMTLIPTDIPLVEPVDIMNFEKNLFTQIEAATWTYNINQLTRDSETKFSLAATTGFTFNNSVTDSNTLNAGLNSQFAGLNVGAGINMPLAKGISPAFTMSASLKPFSFKQEAINHQTEELSKKQELLAINDAEAKYETAVVDALSELEDLLWEQDSVKQSLDMYLTLEKDLKNWYVQGIISESEYLSAKANSQLYSVKEVLNQLDMIIYNNKIQNMFVSSKKALDK